MSGLVHKLGLDFSKFSKKYREINNLYLVYDFSSRCIPKNYCKPYVDNERFEFDGSYLISREKLLILQKRILFSENSNLQLCPTGNECCGIEDVKVRTVTKLSRQL